MVTVNRIQAMISERNDDYLDLLNYAIQLDDVQWQEEILESMRKLNASEETKQEWATTEDLWRQFDKINSRLTEIYYSIRASKDDADKQRLLEQMWELKMQRIDVSRQIKSETSNIEC